MAAEIAKIILVRMNSNSHLFELFSFIVLLFRLLCTVRVLVKVPVVFAVDLDEATRIEREKEVKSNPTRTSIRQSIGYLLTNGSTRE